MSGYRLGVDLGTTYTAAAISDGTRSETVSLGDVAATIPSTVFLREDGTLLFGDAAVQRGVTAPERLAREFKRRIGSHTALLLGGTPMSAHSLTGHLLGYAINLVTQRQGGPPERLVLTHPANWQAYRLELLQQAVSVAGAEAAELVPEPAAAAAHFASTSRLDVGDIAAIYDLGGGTFDAAVVRRTEATFDVLGEPQGLEQLGGVDFDAAVLAHVMSCAEIEPEMFDPDDELAVVSLERLRRECTNAKIQLSSDSDVTIPVDVPGVRTTVRMARGEFEEAVRPAIRETVTAFRRALASAQVSAPDLRAVVLVGGSARVPLVTEMLTTDLQRPVVVSPQPKQSVALGAAMLGTAELGTAELGTAELGAGGRGSQRGSTRVGGQGSEAAGAVDTTSRPPAERPQGTGAPPALPAQRPGSTATVGRAGARPPGAIGLGRKLVAAGGLALVAILLALFGPAMTSSTSGSLTVQGQGLTGPVRLDLSQSVDAAGVAGRSAGMSLKVLGIPLASDTEVPVRANRAEFGLQAARLLAAGPVHAQITDTTTYDFLVVPDKRPFLASIPGAFCVLGVLFVAAYAESVLRAMRRRGTRRLGDTVSLSALGALTGVLLLVTVWGAADRLLAPLTVVLVVALSTATGGLASVGLARPRVGRSG